MNYYSGITPDSSGNSMYFAARRGRKDKETKQADIKAPGIVFKDPVLHELRTTVIQLIDTKLEQALRGGKGQIRKPEQIAWIVKERLVNGQSFLKIAQTLGLRSPEGVRGQYERGLRALTLLLGEKGIVLEIRYEGGKRQTVVRRRLDVPDA